MTEFVQVPLPGQHYNEQGEIVQDDPLPMPNLYWFYRIPRKPAITSQVYRWKQGAMRDTALCPGHDTSEVETDA